MAISINRDNSVDVAGASAEIGPMPMIPVYRPSLDGNETRYVMDAVQSGWISSLGQYVDRFEQAIREVTGARHAIAVSNGSVALHLALHSLDIGRGDEVIVPTFTYIASVNAIILAGATPVFVDVSRDDWLIDINSVERAITNRTKAILPVDLYSAISDPAVTALARDRGLAVVHDCAEVFGATISGRHAGLDADVATFSFFGNKTVTTGEGGAVTTNDDALAARMRKVKGQGQSLTRRYWHDEIGFNYRMTNICAAIGLAQIERLDSIVDRKRQIAALYRDVLADSGVSFQRIRPEVRSTEWLVSVLVPEGVDRDSVMQDMAGKGVDTRPVFYCAHRMPMYAKGQTLPVSEDVSRRGMSLPSYPGLTEDDVVRVADTLKAAIRVQG
jgi:perosamine synthetase